MGGSTGRSSSCCFEDPGIGRRGCISAKGTGTMDQEKRGVLEDHNADYLWPRRSLARGSWLRIFPLEAVRQSVTRMIESSDQSSPSAVGSDHDLADRRTGLWQTDRTEGCTRAFSFAGVLGDRVNATRTAEVILPILSRVEVDRHRFYDYHMKVLPAKRAER